MTKKKLADLSEKENKERALRTAKVLVSGFRARQKDKRIREDDIIESAVAAYKIDPKKSGH